MLVEKLLPTARERLVIIQESASVQDAASLLGADHMNLLVVCDSSGAMVGVVSKTDIVRQIGRCQEHTCTASVSRIMTRKIIACRPQDALIDIWSLMRDRILQCIPIVGLGAAPLGIVYARDALQGLLAEVQNQEELLREYVMGLGYH